MLQHQDYQQAAIGWECPKCHNVYSPLVSLCKNCNSYTIIPKLTEEICQIQEYYRRNPDKLGQSVYISCPCSKCSVKL